MLPASLVADFTGDVTPTYTWSNGNKTLTILTTFTAASQEVTYVGVDVKEAVQ
jgi:hypothetical protein